MIRKKIAEIRAKRKKVKAEAKNLMEELTPVIKKATIIYLEKKYGVKI